MIALGEVLGRVAKMAFALQTQAAMVARLEAELAGAKATLLTIEQVDFPELMTELGLSEIKLSDGTRVTLEADVRCGLSAERKAAAFAWLEEHGFGGLIKTELSASYSRGEVERAQADAARLGVELGRAVAMSREVHPQTLKAFIKEQMEAGATPPEDLFGIAPFSRVKLRAPKAKAV